MPSAIHQQPKKVYEKEVLGRRVVVQFRVGKGVKPFLGQIRQMNLALQDDGSLEAEHFVLFDDGDEQWFDLALEEAAGRLTWVTNGSGRPASSNSGSESTTTTTSINNSSKPPANKKQRTASKASETTISLHKTVTPKPANPKKSTVQIIDIKDENETSSSQDDVKDDNSLNIRNHMYRMSDDRLDGMMHWLTEVPYGNIRGHRRVLKTASLDNANAVMRRVRDLVSGAGVGCRDWPADVRFYKGIAVDLTFDLKKMMQEAKDFENLHGSFDKSGKRLRHPLGKMQLYKEYLFRSE